MRRRDNGAPLSRLKNIRILYYLLLDKYDFHSHSIVTGRFSGFFISSSPQVRVGVSYRVGFIADPPATNLPQIIPRPIPAT